MTADVTHTKSALADKVKEFLVQFKDSTGSFPYVDQIDQAVFAVFLVVILFGVRVAHVFQ